MDEVETKEKLDSVKVFISYGWSSVDNDNWVTEFAERLMSDGVNVKLDKWELKEGQDKHKFMESMVEDKTISKVLIICDKLYKEKADRRKGGVGTESQIISKEVYEKVNQGKFIPIVRERDENNEPFLPIYLGSRIYIDLSDETKNIYEYEKLLRNIYNRPTHKKPPIGSPPTYLFEEEPQKIKVIQILKNVKTAILNDKKIYKGLIRDYLEELSHAFDEFEISEDTSSEIDDEIIKRIELSTVYRDSFIDFVDFVSSYLDDNAYHEDIFSFFQGLIGYKFEDELTGTIRKYSFDNYTFIIHEFFLYLIAILIKHNKLNDVEKYLDNQYYYSSQYNENILPYMIFDGYLESLDVVRNKRLDLKRISVTADLIKSRANNAIISFEQLHQTDIVLSLRSVLNYQDYHYWFPRTIFYHQYTKCELFKKAKMKRYFKILSSILKVKDKEDLLNKYKIGSEKHNLPWHVSFNTYDFSRILNFDELDTI